MAYNANIPQATDQLSQSQLDLLNNFTAINNWVQINHIGFNVANSGKHAFVQFTLQTVNPTLNGEIGLGNFFYGLTGINELWISRFDAIPTRFTYPLTASVLSTVEFPGVNSLGFTYLPSGIIMKWGQTTGLASGANNTITIPANATQGPRFSDNGAALNIFNVQLTAVGGGTVYYVSASGIAPAPQTIVVHPVGTTVVNWLIIGA